MKKSRVITIAENTNTSPSTVSKVLNHRHGISADVRQKVFSEYDRIGGGKKEAAVAVYVILPEIPQYFWSSDYPTLTPEGERIKCNIYSRIGDDEVVLRYLHQALALEAKVIIIAAKINEEMRELLDRFSETGLVIYLTEYNLTRASVYVGSDPADDGKKLAALCRRHIAEEDRLLLMMNTNEMWGETNKIRCDAFLEEMAGLAAYGSCDVDFSTDTSIMPSLLAREMLPLLVHGSYNKLICFTGFTHVLCGAVRKMRLPHTVQCFGFEDTPQNSKFAEMGLLGGVVSQNFPKQIAAAFELAFAFVATGARPEKENVIIPCDILEY